MREDQLLTDTCLDLPWPGPWLMNHVSERTQTGYNRVHAVWEIFGGPAAGQSLRFGTDNETTVGRTDAADIPLTADFFLSRVHFVVRYDASEDQWYVRDLESRHGTFLNGERVAEATDVAVAQGDELKAGKSELRFTAVNTDDAISGEGEAVAAVAVGAAVMFVAVEASNRAPSANPEFEYVECASGLGCITAEQSEPTPAGIAWLLAREYPLHLLADFSKLSLPRPAQLEQVDYLFNWMDEDVLPHCSPVLLGPGDPIDPYEIIDELWGQDAILCLFSTLEKPELLVRLRAAIRRDDGLSTEVPKGILGYCWPEAARAVLESAPKKLTAPLMDNLTAVLLESEDLEQWRLYFATGMEKRIRGALVA